MKLDIGMSRAGLRNLANDILAECDRDRGRGEGVEVMVHAEANGRGPILTLTFNNDDMEGRDDENVAYWEMES